MSAPQRLRTPPPRPSPPPPLMTCSPLPDDIDENGDDLLPPHIEIPPNYDETDTVLSSLHKANITVLIPDSHILYHEASRARTKRYKRNFAVLKQYVNAEGVMMEIENSYAVFLDEHGLRLRLFSVSQPYLIEERVPLDETRFFDASHVAVIEAGEDDDEETPKVAHFGNSRPDGWL